MSVKALKSQIFAMLIAALWVAPALSAVEIKSKFVCSALDRRSDFSVSTGDISLINQKKLIVDRFECKSHLCNNAKISAKVVNSDGQIFNVYLHAPTRGCVMQHKYTASNRETRYTVELTEKLRFSSLERMTISFENVAICTLVFSKSVRNAIRSTDPDDYGLKCSEQYPQMLVLFDLSETNCAGAYEGKVRVLSNKNLQIRNFKAKDLFGYKEISFIVRENTRPVYIRVLELLKLRSGFSTKVPSSDLAHQSFDEAMFATAKSIDLVLPVGFKVTNLIRFEIHDEHNQVVCSVEIGDPPTEKDIGELEVSDSSTQPWALQF